MNKDTYKILGSIVTLLEDKLKNDYDNCHIGNTSFLWAVYDKVPLSNEEIKARMANPGWEDGDDLFDEKLKHKVEITIHPPSKKEAYIAVFKGPSIQISIDLDNEDETSLIPIRLFNRFRSSVRRTRLLIKKANEIKVNREMAKIDSLHAKIQPNRIDKILLGEDDDNKES